MKIKHFRRAVFLLVLFLSWGNTYSQDIVNQLDSEISLKYKWKTKIGLTTFKSTISYSDGHIYIGSNGISSKSLNDSLDGVYFIEAKSGNVSKHIQGKMLADSDVNGIALNDQFVYFGNDNDSFFCYNHDGEEVWSFGTDGDIEGAPALSDLNYDGLQDVVFASEEGSVYALDGKSGELIWKYITEWERGGSKYEYLSSKGFIASPTLYDINNDHVRDVLIGARNATFYALDGTTGSVIWKYNTFSGIHSSAFIDNSKGNVELLFAEAYSDVHILNLDGTLKKKIELKSSDGSIQGLFSSPIKALDNICIGTSWWHGASWLTGDGFFMIDMKNSSLHKSFMDLGTVSSTPFCADVLGTGFPQIGITTENGFLMLYEDPKSVIAKFQLSAGVEATPLIADVDNDNYLEILIATKDGYLYCYDTKSNGTVSWGQFRGNNYNSGVIVGE